MTDDAELPAARVVHSDDLTGMEVVSIGTHEIQCGGADGDGFCYTHQTFECLENLTDLEAKALSHAR